jgi:hypothetical protein
MSRDGLDNAAQDWGVIWNSGIQGSADGCHVIAELGIRSFFQGSLSGSLTLMRSFFEIPVSLVAQTLVAQPVVR